MAKTSTPTDVQPKQGQPLPGHATKYDYVIDWIKESVEARRAQNIYVERAIRAYQGHPSENRYKKSIKQYVESVKKNDAMKAKDIEASCNDLPDKTSMAVHNAVETLVSMAQGGVGQYEFGPYDPQMKKDPQTMDRLAAAAKSFYLQNKVDSVMPQYIRMAVLSGVGTLHLKQKNKKKIITLLETQQMLTDPKRAKTNFQRFIGHTQRESFQAVKDRVKKTKGGGYVLKSLNEAEVYLSQITLEMNSVLQSDTTQTFLHDQIRRDVDIFYKPIVTRIQDRRNTENNPNLMYDGDEIECTYLYDEMNDIYFEIVNRRYIVLAKPNPLKRDIKCMFYDDKGEEKEKTKTVRLDNPYVELAYIKTFWDTYALSPLFYVLDDFDDLCAMESVLYHNLSIMAPLTFVGQSSDAEKISRIASVSGEIVEALPQTFGVLDKKHDITPVVTAIQRMEEKIKRTLKAVDPFELQGMIGDRATAKEVVSASGQVSQGINPFLANVETAMSCLGDKFIKLELIMNDEGIYSFAHNGRYAELSTQEMAGDYEINAKLVSSIKLEQEANSRKALELIQYLTGGSASEALDMKKFLGATVPIVLSNLLSRQTVEDMVQPAYKPMPEEVVAAIKRRAEENAAKHPIDKLELPDDPATLDRLIAEHSSMAAEATNPTAALPVDPTIAMVQGNQPAEGVPTIPVDQSGAPIDQGAPAPGAGAPPVDPSVLAAIAGGAPNVAPPQSGPASPEQAGIVANDQMGGGYGL